MPFYAISQGEFPKSVPFPWLPARGVDANGQSIPGTAIAVDTDSGDVYYFREKPDGSLVRREEDGTAKVFYDRYAPPIILIRVQR